MTPDLRIFAARQHLAHIDFLEESLARLNAEVAQRVAPFEEEIVRGDPVPGVNRRTMEVVIAEIAAPPHALEECWSQMPEIPTT